MRIQILRTTMAIVEGKDSFLLAALHRQWRDRHRQTFTKSAPARLT